MTIKTLPEYLLWLEEMNLAMKPGDKEYGLADCFQKAIKRVKFGQLKPQLGDFIPTDDDGEPLAKKVISVKKYKKGLAMSGDALEDLVDEYEDALEDVLFEGGKLVGNHTVQYDKEWYYDFEKMTLHQDGGRAHGQECETIEDLINSRIELISSKACIKKYGLPEKVAA